jgi:hypothetical protein
MRKPQEIREYIKTQLSTPTISGIANVYSSFYAPKQDDSDNVIVIYDTTEDASEPMSNYDLSERQLGITIEIIAETTDGDISQILDDYAGIVEDRVGMSHRSSGPRDKPYNTLFYRGREKIVATDGGAYVGSIQLRFIASYDLSFES